MTTFVPPTPMTWTLRLKAHKTTVFLHINQLTTFATIKQHLFAAIQDTTLSSTNGLRVTLPSSPSEIQLGRPVDINDPQSGFMLGEWERATDGDDGDTRGKGKAKARPRKDEDDELAGKENINQCPKGAGLKDNAVLAFRWPGDGTGWEEEEDEEMGDEEGSSWGVKIPSYEDQYGMENVGDVGGRRAVDE
ncbi:hypothetical protein B0J11DRAFT_581875 [Dendryphion nanum]|uniref:Uncharacterized protein n=1 Tax=Dendryphion nanum TaxID=256645 RepID=A0A9P9DKZ2_9PLEO|nr:hypothetical protein B0J11DRAFT_581875 [Dendryphion nanum]